MINLLSCFLVTFFAVGFRVSQTRNVVHKRYKTMFVNSWLIEACQFMVILKVVDGSFYEFLALGLGASCGSVLFVYLHSKVFKDDFKR